MTAREESILLRRALSNEVDPLWTALRVAANACPGYLTSVGTDSAVAHRARVCQGSQVVDSTLIKVHSAQNAWLSVVNRWLHTRGAELANEAPSELNLLGSEVDRIVERDNLISDFVRAELFTLASIPPGFGSLPDAEEPEDDTAGTIVDYVTLGAIVTATVVAISYIG